MAVKPLWTLNRQAVPLSRRPSLIAWIGRWTGCFAFVLWTLLSVAMPTTPALTYTGRLLDAGLPANGEFDLQFTLNDAPASGNTIGPTLRKAPVFVTNGLFRVDLEWSSTLFNTKDLAWLEVEVRPNGSQDAYTVMSPRQPLTVSAYALLAQRAEVATTAGSLVAGAAVAGNGAGLTNLDASALASGTISLDRLSEVTELVASNTTFLSELNSHRISSFGGQGTNTTLWARRAYVQVTTNSNEQDMTVYFNSLATNRHIVRLSFDTGGSEFLWNPFHSGAGEMQITAPAIAIGPGYDCWPPHYTGYRRLQFGIGEYKHPWFDFKRDFTPSPADPFAYSSPMRFEIADIDGNYLYPTLMGRMFGTNRGSLLFFKNFDTALQGTNWNWSAARLGGEMYVGAETGWNLRGKLVQERQAEMVTTNRYALDFSKPYCVDATLPDAGSVTLYTTNEMAGATNFENHIFILRAAGGALTIQYPGNWATNGTELPKQLALGQMLCLELSSLGRGETNKILRACNVFNDPTFSPGAKRL